MSNTAFRLNPRTIVNGWIRANRRAPTAGILAAAKAAAEDPANRDAHMKALKAHGPIPLIGAHSGISASIAFHHALGASLKA